MKEKDLLESIIRDSNKDEQRVYEFCKFHNITLEEYRERLDRSIAARRKYTPNFPGKAPKGYIPEHLKHIRKDTK